MLCLILGVLIYGIIGGIIGYKACYGDLISTLIGAIVFSAVGLIIGTGTGYIISEVAPTEIVEYSKTYEISPIEENLYVISDGDKYIVRQKEKLVDVSRDITEIEKAEHSEITYFYEEKNYKEPWRTLIAPTDPITTLKAVSIKTQEDF